MTHFSACKDAVLGGGSEVAHCASGEKEGKGHLAKGSRETLGFGFESVKLGVEQ